MKKIRAHLAYSIATMGGLGKYSEGGPVAGALGFAGMWFLPQVAEIGSLNLTVAFFVVLLALSFVVQQALFDERVVWYGDVAVAPTIVLDWFIGSMIAVYQMPHTLLVYSVAFLLYMILSLFKPLGIRQARVLPGFWGILADDVAAGLLTHLVVSFIFS